MACILWVSEPSFKSILAQYLYYRFSIHVTHCGSCFQIRESLFPRFSSQHLRYSGYETQMMNDRKQYNDRLVLSMLFDLIALKDALKEFSMVKKTCLDSLINLRNCITMPLHTEPFMIKRIMNTFMDIGMPFGKSVKVFIWILLFRSTPCVTNLIRIMK